MKIPYDFRMNYKLTVELRNGTTIEREFDNYNAFRLMHNYICSKWEEYTSDYIDFSGTAMIRPDCILDMKGEYVEYLLEA